VPCSIIDAKPDRPLLRGGNVTLFQTLNGVGAFANAHRNAHALRSMVCVTRHAGEVHASRSGRVAGLIICAQ